MTEMTFTDNLSPFLKKLFDISDGLGMQAMSKGASEVRKLMVKQSKSLGNSEWSQRFDSSGRRLLTTDGDKRLYDRVSKSRGGQKQAPMGKLIRYKQYPLSRTVLVGWVDTKSYNTLFYTGGIPKKGNYVKGTKTKAIAERMTKGGRQTLTGKQRKLFEVSGFPEVAKRGYVNYKAHRFMTPMRYLQIINDKAKKEFDVAVQQFIQASA